MSLYFVGDLNILADDRLSAHDKLVYFCLVSYMNVKDGKCHPRYATIKKRTGISIAAIQRSVKHLAKLKFITVKRLSSTNLYLLSGQKILQETIKKRVITLSEGRDISHRGVLIKPSYKTNNRFNRSNFNYNRSSSTGGVAKHSIEYNGEKYTECGREGHYVEYSNGKGDRIKKHSFKKDEPIKKFDAARKAALCA